MLLSIPAALAQQTPVSTAPPAVVDPSRHTLAFVTVKGVKVPYLDWGGAGVALVFIPGMGNSAHVFDDFAPRFTDRFRVLGVTRVGFGESDQPQRDGYDLASRVAHIRTSLDALKIRRAVLIGHSLGGDEITAFAGTYPERTAGLVYLDAAIDHTKVWNLEEEVGEFYKGVSPTTADLASAHAFQQYIARQQGIKLPIGEILALNVFDPAGIVRRRRASQHVNEAIVAATVPPEYTKVQAPVLSLYSDHGTAAEEFPWLREDPALIARAAAFLVRTQALLDAERARFAREVKGAQVFAYRTHHYQFLSDPGDTERRMRAFLSSLKTP